MALWNSKKSNFIKEQEVKGLLINFLEVKVLVLNGIPIDYTLSWKYKMNAIVNKLLIAGDALMNLYQKCFGNCLDLYIGPFTKNKRIKKNIKETANSRYSYQNELNKACFQYDVAYGDFKDLNRRVTA